MKKVYVLINPDNKRVKIGVTDNINRRLNNLRHSSGSDISVYFLSHWLDDAYGLETKAHRHFKKYNYLGEWFDIDAETAANYIRMYEEDFGVKYGYELVKDGKNKETCTRLVYQRQKQRYQEINDYKEHVLTDPLTRFTRVKGNVYYRKISKEYFDIRYRNKQWIIKKLKDV